jgi:Amt family ammonium transporter
MVRTTSVLNMLLMNVYCMAIVPLVWVIVGLSLASGDVDENPLIGDFDLWFLEGVTTADALAIMAFGLTFAVITPALISGAVADRMKFSAWALFVPLWSLLVYSPVVYWIYAPEGWIKNLPALDFAGGTAIHINAGVAALAAVLVLGRRQGWPSDAMPPHNLPLTLLGAGILWFGWFGFNAGSALAANYAAAQAFVNTFLAAAAAMFAWMVVERLRDGHFTTLGAASGVVAGLVAITPCAGFVAGVASIPIGALAGVACYFAIQAKFRFGYDDSLDVVGIHMVGGIVGGVLLGFFADPSNYVAQGLAEFPEGVFFGGGADLLLDQIVSIVGVLAYSFVVTGVIMFVLNKTMGVRVDAESERAGIDGRQHVETAYS